MKKTILVPIYAACVLLFASCQEAAKQETPAVTMVAEAPKPDLAQIKTEIQAMENTWADALNKKDINALMALYADGAMTMQDDGPTLVGKADIQKQQEADFATRKFASYAFETLEVYAGGDHVTEIGTSNYLDKDGKSVGTGKYMAIFVKKDGKYLCLREIYNLDSK